MFVLNALPEEVSLPLDSVGLPGVVARYRPCDAEEIALWVGAFTDKPDQAPVIVLVKRQLIALDGLAVKVGGTDALFDVKNPLHFRALKTKHVKAIYDAIMERTALTEEQEKNSDSPSALEITPSTASSLADGVASDDATSTTVG